MADVGTGTPLVVLHGIPEDRHSFDRLLQPLAGCCRVIAPDLRGFGRSQERPRDPRLDLPLMSRDLECVLRVLGLARPVLLGHDVGGFVAAHYVQKSMGPVRGLILVNTTYRKLRLSGSPHVPLLAAPLLGPLALWLLGGRVADLAFRFGFVDPSRADPVHVAHCRELASRPETRRSLAEVYASIRRAALAKRMARAKPPEPMRIPALILWGDRDRFLHRDLAEWLRHLLPEAELIRFPQAGHFPHQECPEPVARAICKFLDRLG